MPDAKRFTDLPPILIADDNPDDVFFLERGLRQAGVENPVLTFENGQDAIAFLRDWCAGRPEAVGAGTPCVLFLDIKMPLVSGFEVLEWARQQPTLAKLEIVILSGSTANSDIAKAKELGAKRYLLKPPTAEAVGEIARAAMAAREAN